MKRRHFLLSIGLLSVLFLLSHQTSYAQETMGQCTCISNDASGGVIQSPCGDKNTCDGKACADDKGTCYFFVYNPETQSLERSSGGDIDLEVDDVVAK